MSATKYDFQYCQKLVVFSVDWGSVLLARRRDEADYDGTFAFIGGKMETDDASIVAGLRREKDEEIGRLARLRVYIGATNNVLYRKNDGSSMILPHYLAQFAGGDIEPNDEEYSELRWVSLGDLVRFEPKIENIPNMVNWALVLKSFADADPKGFVEF